MTFISKNKSTNTLVPVKKALNFSSLLIAKQLDASIAVLSPVFFKCSNQLNATFPICFLFTFKILASAVSILYKPYEAVHFWKRRRYRSLDQ